MLKQVVIGAGLVGAGLVGGAFGLRYEIGKVADKQIGAFDANLPSGVSITYGGRTISLLSGAVDFTDFTLRRPIGSQELTITGAGARVEGLYPLLLGLSTKVQAIKFAGLSVAAFGGQPPGRIERAEFFGVRASSISVPGDPNFQIADMDRIEIYGISSESGGEKITAQSMKAGSLSQGVLKDVEFTNLAAGVKEPTPAGFTLRRLLIDHCDLAQLTRSNLANPSISESTVLAAMNPGLIRGEDLAVEIENEGRMTTRVIEVDGFTHAGDMLTGYHFKGDHIGIDGTAELAATAKASWGLLGYPTIDASMEVTAKFDPEHRIGMVDPLRVSIQDAGTFTLSAHVGNLPSQSLADAGEEAISDATDAITVIDFTASYEDHSLTKRIEHLLAQQDGVEDEAWIENMSQTLSSVGSKSESAQAIQAAMISFLRQPGRLTLSMKPDEPISLGQLEMTAQSVSDPDAIQELLNFTLVAE